MQAPPQRLCLGRITAEQATSGLRFGVGLLAASRAVWSLAGSLRRPSNPRIGQAGREGERERESKREARERQHIPSPCTPQPCNDVGAPTEAPSGQDRSRTGGVGATSRQRHARSGVEREARVRQQVTSPASSQAAFGDRFQSVRSTT
jgi:hypothetical protein